MPDRYTPQRRRIWTHNSFLGHCAMHHAHFNSMERADTLTDEARAALREARAANEKLSAALKTRRDPE